MRAKKQRGGVAALVMVLFFIAMLGMVVFGTAQVSGQATTEGAVATQQAIERAAVLCYASEGFYPPGLSYIEQNYGVQIDHQRYAVHYSVFASNIMPEIRVVAR